MALLQVAALGFFLNAVSAYGACSMAMSAPDSKNVEQIPCHGAAHDVADTPDSDFEAESDSGFDNCCSTCVLMALSFEAGFATHPEPVALRAPTTSGPVAGGFDPPFRPPITVLS